MCTKTIAFSIILASYSLVSEHIRGSSGLDLFNALRSKLVYLPVTVSLSSQRLSGNFYNSCAETQLKTREQHHEKTFKRPGWSAYWNSSRETALFPLSSCKLRSPFRVQWRSRSHSFSLSLFFWTHRGMGWTSAEPENSSDHWTNAPQACALQAPHMWPPEPCQVKSRTPEFCQHTCRTSRLLSCPFSGWITGFSDRGRKIQTQTYNHCDKLESTAMTAAMWGST